MTHSATVQAKTNSWPISVGAEGIAAAQFARCGFDVSVQAGRDTPWYDLVVTRGSNLLKVSVKASEDGQWSLTQGYSRRPHEVGSFDYRAAIDRWVNSYGQRTVCCLVQFADVSLHELPRIYLAFPQEVAVRMRDTADRMGQCALFEQYSWAPGDGSCRIEALPADWKFSHQRIEEMLRGGAAPYAAAPKPAVLREVALTA